MGYVLLCGGGWVAEIKKVKLGSANAGTQVVIEPRSVAFGSCWENCRQGHTVT